MHCNVTQCAMPKSDLENKNQKAKVAAVGISKFLARFIRILVLKFCENFAGRPSLHSLEYNGCLSISNDRYTAVF